MIAPASIKLPTSLIDANSASCPAGVLNQIRLTEKKQIREAKSNTRSTKIVTRAAPGRTRRSRIGSHIGRTISPIRPIRNIAVKPTVVVANSSLRLDLVIGSSNTCQRTALKKYPKQMISVAAIKYQGLAFLTLAVTTGQSRFRPKNQKINAVTSNSKMNFMYLRKVIYVDIRVRQ